MSDKSTQVRCPKCNKLLFKADIVAGQVEIQCPRCKVSVRWPSTQPEIVVSDPKRKLISEM